MYDVQNSISFVGAKMGYHMLETSRICSIDSNFHVFYSLVFGSPTDLLKKCSLDPLIKYEVSIYVI